MSSFARGHGCGEPAGPPPHREREFAWDAAIPETSQDRLYIYAILLDHIFVDKSNSNQLEIYLPKLVPYLIRDIGNGESAMIIPSIDVLAWILSGEACDLGVERTASALSKTPLVGSQPLIEAYDTSVLRLWENIETTLLSVASNSHSCCSDAAGAQYHTAVLATVFFLLHENKVFRGAWVHRDEWVRLAVACLSRPCSVPEATRLRAFDVFNKLLSDTTTLAFSPKVEVDVTSEVGACLTSASLLERRCYLEFLDIVTSAEDRGIVIRSEIQSVKNAMEIMHSALIKASSQDVPELASRVGPAWRLWIKCIIRGVPHRKLRDFLRDGSSDASTAGFLLRPVEALLRLSSAPRLEGCRCWRALAEQFVATEHWTKDNKIMKLLLSCCIYIFEKEEESVEIISVIADTMDLMLRHSWPCVEAVLDAEVRAQGGICTLRTFLERTLAHPDLRISESVLVLKFHVGASLLYLHEPFDLASTTPPLASDNDLMRRVLQCGKQYEWFLSKMNDIVVFWRLISTRVVSKEFHESDANKAVFTFCSSVALKASTVWSAYLDLVGNYLVSFERGMNIANIMSQFTPPSRAGHEGMLVCGSSAEIVLSADDAPGTDKPVLAATSPLAATTILEIASMALNLSIWSQSMNDKSWAIKTREIILSSLMNLSHKVSAFDLMPVSNSLNNRVVEIWRSLTNYSDRVNDRSLDSSDGNILQSHGSLGSFIFLLTLGQAYSFETVALDNDHADSFCRTMTRSIQRSMNSILECRALPDIIAWLPDAVQYLLEVRKPGKDLHCDKESSEFNICLVRDLKNHSKSFVSCQDEIIGCIANCAARALEKMPIGDEVVNEYNQKRYLSVTAMKANLVSGLLKLASLPAMLVQGNRCFSLWRFDNYGPGKHYPTFLPWKKLFQIIVANGERNDVSELCNFIPASVDFCIPVGITPIKEPSRCAESMIEFIRYAVAVLDHPCDDTGLDDDRESEQICTSIKYRLAQLAAKLLSIIIFSWASTLWSIGANQQNMPLSILKQLCATTLAGEVIRAILLVDQILDVEFKVKISDRADCPVVNGLSTNPASFGALSFHLLFIGIPKALRSTASVDLHKLYSAFVLKILCEISFAVNNNSLGVKYKDRLLKHFLGIEELVNDPCYDSNCEMGPFKAALSDLITEIRKSNSNRYGLSAASPKEELFRIGRAKRGFLPESSEADVAANNAKRIFDNMTANTSDNVSGIRRAEGSSEAVKRMRTESFEVRLNSLQEIVQRLKGISAEGIAEGSCENWNDLIRDAENILLNLKRK